MISGVIFVRTTEAGRRFERQAGVCVRSEETPVHVCGSLRVTSVFRCGSGKIQSC